MQKLGLIQTLQQKLSPQQIQFIKLLQIPTAELETRIEEELETNPALEEGAEENEEESLQTDEIDSKDESNNDDDISIEDYLQDDYSGYKMQGDGVNPDEDEREIPIPSAKSLNDHLKDQLGLLGLDSRAQIIGEQLIGSLESDGYIRREMDAIVNDLAFSQNIETTVEELEEILQLIQEFDPPGIGARTLQECLLIQLRRNEEPHNENDLACRIMEYCFDDLSKKHFDKIIRKLSISEQELRDAINIIVKLNPKPGNTGLDGSRVQYLMPDFILTNNNGKLELTLNSKNAPELKISRSYAEMLHAYDKSKNKDKQLRETVSFLKQKLDSAMWFINAIRQRQMTLLNTMSAIVDYQYDFFLTGEESKLRPMILKDIATRINMDISTVSRVANSKSVQTEFGIFPLKYFFSEGISTESGEDVSSREVKLTLKEYIENEDKRKPLSDDKLEKLLKMKGYNIARRTVAKYREQLHIPVARLRKEV